MSKNVTSEQQSDKVVDNFQHIVHQSLGDIQDVIALLENSLLEENSSENLSENLPAIHAIVDHLIQEFKHLDEQLQGTIFNQQVHQNYQDLAQKTHLKNLLSNWVLKNNLDKTA
jgi:hypothetical protein